VQPYRIEPCFIGIVASLSLPDFCWFVTMTSSYSSSLSSSYSSSSSHPPPPRDEREERKILERLRNTIRFDHGSGNFADALARNVTVRSFRFARQHQHQQQQHQHQQQQQQHKHQQQQHHQLVLSFPVTPELCNGFDTLHGGAQATAVDVFTSVLLYGVSQLPSVTTDLHVSCLSPAPLGSTVVCVCRVERASGTLQFASCDLYREDGGGSDGGSDGDDTNSDTSSDNNAATLVPVAKGLHTKYVLKRRIKGFVGDSGSNRSSNSQHGSTARTKTPRSKL